MPPQTNGLMPAITFNHQRPYSMNYELAQEMEEEFSAESLEHELAHESLHEDEFAHELGESGAHEGEFSPEASFEDEFSLESSGYGELEDEWSSEGEYALESLMEDEGESGLLGEWELGEYEDGEQFFKKAFRGIGRLVKSAVPVLGKVASIATPLVAKAVGGAFGGPAGAALMGRLGGMAASALRGGGLPKMPGGLGQLAGFGKSLGLFENGAYEYENLNEALEWESQELESHEVQAELMAHFAAGAATEMEMEALIGSSVALSLSARDRAALRRLVPALVRGAAILARVLRMRRGTRQFVRTVPTIVRHTAKSLVAGARGGQPLTQARAARVMAGHTHRVLTSPRRCARALGRNLAAARPMATQLGRRGRF